jgi:hypothetical protein
MNETPVPPSPGYVDVTALICRLEQILRPAPPFVHNKVQADKQLLQRAAVYHGGLLQTTVGGTSIVKVYDGLDTSGELIDAWRTAANIPEHHVYERGIVLQTGLYVDLGDNVAAFTVYYQPVPRDRG